MEKSEVIKLWVEALRSGEYRQTKETLSRTSPSGETGYCCLGVLCHIAEQHHLVDKIERSQIGGEDYKSVDLLGDSGTENTFAVAELVGMEEGFHNTLCGMNDSDSSSFKEIADYIEREL